MPQKVRKVCVTFGLQSLLEWIEVQEKPVSLYEGDDALTTSDASLLKISGYASDSFFGAIVWPSGDLNNDGRDDVLIGSVDMAGGEVNIYSFTPGASSANALVHQNAISIVNLSFMAPR